MESSLRAPPRVRTRPGQVGLFWASSLTFGASSFAVLAVLARHVGPGQFAAATAVFGLVFVAAVVPSAVQLRAAALRGTGRGKQVPWRTVGMLALGLLALSPVLGPVLRLPAGAVALVVAQILPAVALGALRGALIGDRRLAAAAANLGVEAAARFVAGVGLALAWASTGLAAGLLVATLVGLAVVPRSPAARGARRAAPVTPFVPTVLALGGMMLLANIDIILAPSALGDVAADAYDIAAVPSRWVFGGLLALGWLAVPGARRRARPLLPALAAVLLGVVGTGVLVVLRPLIGVLLGRPAPDALLLALLGLAMAAAAGTSVCVHLAVTLGAARPWLPLSVTAAAVAVFAVTRPDPLGLGGAVLAAHAIALALALRLVAIRAG